MKKQKRAIAIYMAILLLAGTVAVEPLRASAEEQSNVTQVEEGEEQVSQGIDTSKEDTVSEEEQEESNKDLSDEQEQNNNISDDDNEDIEELKANSWRYQDGEPVAQDNGCLLYTSRCV